MGTGDASNKRRHIRFTPDPLDYAQISLDLDAATFTPDFVALIVEESPMGGCGLAMLQTDRVVSGTKLLAKVGRLTPLRSEVVWVRKVDDHIMRLGLRFLE
jgi:hypothetical protein